MDQQIPSGSNSDRLSRPFAPIPLDRLLNASLDNIPTYLFRVSDHKSPGTTNPTEVCSPAFINLEQGADLYGMKRERAAYVLRNHLQWECTSVVSSCNLMSWTSSLLFALQYAFYRHNYWKGNEDFSDTFILIVDTRQFKRGAFARDLQAMEAYKGISNTGYKNLDDLYEQRRSGRFYFGEYLSQGRLEIDPERGHQVTIGNLIRRGLFDINPELKDDAHWYKCAKRVNQLRDLIQKGPIVQRSDIQAVMNVAEAFQPFVVPVAAMLLTIGPYKLDCKAPIILEELRRQYTENNISGLLWINVGPEASLPELQGYKNLIYGLKRLMKIRFEDIERKSERTRAMKADVEDLIAAVNDLSV